MPYSPRPFTALMPVLASILVGCGGSSRPGRQPQTPGPEAQSSRRATPTQPDAVKLYRQMGLLAEGGETPFVGSVSFLGAKTVDSTMFVLTVSIPTRALTFVRENDRYRASYSATLALTRASEAARRFETHHIVRVASFKETTRTDESVLYQQMVLVRPGSYELSFALRDDAGGKGSSIDATMSVPRMSDGSLSSPIPVYEVAPRTTLDSLPRIVPSPRATLSLGQDSSLAVYIEGYGSGSTMPIRAAIFGENASLPVWTDTTSLPRRGSLFGGQLNVPVSRLGVGALTLAVTSAQSTDTTKAPIFVTFGEDLPVATFSEMVNYLRYFGSTSRLESLRDAPPDARAAAWASFMRETDPDPATAQNEALRDYFGRIAQANSRFREEGGTGWLTDRGRVFVALGTPDQFYEPNTSDLNQRGRAQIWEYRRHRLQVVFIDQTGFGRWRMTVGSEAEFESIVRRELARNE
jgi:GWxTD domain-containing protein